MNKKLVAAAIAAAMTAPAAFADVTVYGKIHMSVDSVDEDAGFDGQAIASRASRIGFKGSEDLGNGLKAVWKSEWAINTDGTGGPTNARDNYLGVAGNFGTFLLAGNINTPFKNSTAKMDFFADTLADNNNTVGFEDLRVDNAIVYLSPKFSGLQFAAAATAGEGVTGPVTSGRTGGDDSLASGYSMAVTYNNAGIMAAVAYEDMSDTTGSSADSKFRIGLGYKMDAFKIAAIYEDQSDRAGAAGVDATFWQINAGFTMGNNTIKAMYGDADIDNSTTAGGAWAVGVDHKMSKRTKVYALYTDSDNGMRGESNGNYGTGSGFSVGMMHSF